MIIIDTRDKLDKIQHILNYFDEEGIQYDRSKLYFGDYMDYSNPKLVIDRKQNIQELAQNCTREHARFKEELEKVKATGSELIVLVEQNAYTDRGRKVYVKSIEDLMLWESYFGEVRGEKVYRVLVSWTKKYPLRIEFCAKSDSPKRIIELLQEGDRDE